MAAVILSHNTSHVCKVVVLAEILAHGRSEGGGGDALPTPGFIRHGNGRIGCYAVGPTSGVIAELLSSWPGPQLGRTWLVGATQAESVLALDKDRAMRTQGTVDDADHLGHRVRRPRGTGEVEGGYGQRAANEQRQAGLVAQPLEHVVKLFAVYVELDPGL
jgi:hypothetical protein